MNSLEIEKLIISRLSQWEHFSQARTERANRSFTPPKTGVWLRVSIKGGVNHIASISQTPCVQENGLLIVQLFDRDNVGTKALKEQADSLAKHMGLYQDGRLELLAPSVIDVGASDGFYQLNVSVPYRYY